MGIGGMTILLIQKIGYILVIWMVIGIGNYQFVVTSTGMGFIDACSSPELAHAADSRHPNSYGRVFAVSSTATSLGFILGPVIGRIESLAI